MFLETKQKITFQTCQRLVTVQPCNSHALYLLGDVQLMEYDSDPQGPEAENLLAAAIVSFKASIVLEGKPMSGEAPEEIKSE